MVTVFSWACGACSKKGEGTYEMDKSLQVLSFPEEVKKAHEAQSPDCQKQNDINQVAATFPD